MVVIIYLCTLLVLLKCHENENLLGYYRHDSMPLKIGVTFSGKWSFVSHRISGYGFELRISDFAKIRRFWPKSAKVGWLHVV